MRTFQINTEKRTQQQFFKEKHIHKSAFIDFHNYS